MKLNKAYLCPDCEEVFSFKDNAPNFIASSIIIQKQDLSIENLQFCPVCGNQHVLNIGRILNRKEEKNNETFIDSGTGGFIDHPDRKPDISFFERFYTSSTYGCVEIIGNQGGDRRSGQGDNGSREVSKQTDGTVGAIACLVDTLGELIQSEGCLKQTISRIDADSTEGSLS